MNGDVVYISRKNQRIDRAEKAQIITQGKNKEIICTIQINILSLRQNDTSMGYRILSASRFISKLKATVHTSGKLGFSEVTAKELGLFNNEEHFVQFAQDTEDPSVLYLINGTADDGDSFKVCKSGAYFYINAKLMFDSLGVDYINKTIIYDMIKSSNEEGDVYRMTKRELPKSKKEEK